MSIDYRVVEEVVMLERVESERECKSPATILRID